MTITSVKRKADWNLSEEERSSKAAKVDQTNEVAIQSLKVHDLTRPQASASSSSNNVLPKDDLRQMAIEQADKKLRNLINQVCNELAILKPETKIEQLNKIKNLLVDALEIAPNDLNVNSLLAEYNFLMEKYEEALKLFKNVLQYLKPSSADYITMLYKIAEAYRNLDPALAITFCSDQFAIEKDLFMKTICQLMYANCLANSMRAKKCLKIGLKDSDDILMLCQNAIQSSLKMDKSQQEMIHHYFMGAIRSYISLASDFFLVNVTFTIKSLKKLTSLLLSFASADFYKKHFADFYKKHFNELFTVFKKFYHSTIREKVYTDTCQLFSMLAELANQLEISDAQRGQIFLWKGTIAKVFLVEDSNNNFVANFESQVLKPLRSAYHLTKDNAELLLLNAEILFCLVNAMIDFHEALNHKTQRANTIGLNLDTFTSQIMKHCESLMSSDFNSVFLSSRRPVNAEGALAMIRFLHSSVEDPLLEVYFQILLNTLENTRDQLPNDENFWVELILVTKTYDNDLAKKIVKLSKLSSRQIRAIAR